ncbi:4-(cytidine 5'-diphospho)-2-C-methyl-D-erythritol kinase [uncultured Desulfobulbus sp.]|uniref:4-(cytidine 5'-diphospho)-2-C-methyl-D-erythritol kinase n=1 Tax=uncultured Desulfobulbus sp. TaxID=239745 RepID=UPI0029C65265|nr:4-(cytidine 5'-diphospho)-2-C-methyl-D-erythritol kinase [uncultured Desulfobulbus sp.]
MDIHTEITRNAYAKINLTLDILGVEADGYHRLRSVMQTISLHDVITVRRGKPGIRLICSDKEIPSDSRNLAYRAAESFCAVTGIMPEFEITLDKQIPHQAGLGGGSSDAASVLAAFNIMHDEPLTKRVLCNIGAGIGSDVPFFIYGGTVSVGGRGEHIEILPPIPVCHLVIVKPKFGISTAWAYRRLDEIRDDSIARAPDILITNSMIEYLNAGDWDRLPALISNDLEQPSIEKHPVIAEIKRQMVNLGSKGALMCGSGSAVFGIFGSESEAVNASSELNEYGDVYTAYTIHPDTETDSELI